MGINDVVIESSVGKGGVNKEADKIPIKVLLNKFITAGKLPGCPVLSLAGKDHLSEPELNQLILEFQEKYVPNIKPDGRIDGKPHRSKTLEYLNKQPSQVAPKPKQNGRISYLSGAVGRRKNLGFVPNIPKDVLWVQKRLNVKIHFGKIPGRAIDNFIPENGTIVVHNFDDLTIFLIGYLMSYHPELAPFYPNGGYNPVIEPGDKFDQWLQQVVVQDVDTFLTKEQKIRNAIHNAINSDYFRDTPNQHDNDIKFFMNNFLRPGCDDSYLTYGQVVNYAGDFINNSFPLPEPEHLMKTIITMRINNEGKILKNNEDWVKYLRGIVQGKQSGHSIPNIIKSGIGAFVSEGQEAPPEKRVKLARVINWYRTQSKKANTLWSGFTFPDFEHMDPGNLQWWLNSFKYYREGQ